MRFPSWSLVLERNKLSSRQNLLSNNATDCLLIFDLSTNCRVSKVVYKALTLRKTEFNVSKTLARCC